jgi:hypothetical protein
VAVELRDNNAETDYSVQTIGFTPAPQPLKSGWSQVVRQQTRGTVSAPASPSKKQSNPSAGSRRDAPTSGLGRKFEAERSDRATTSGKTREDRASGSAGAANHSRIVHAGPSSHPSEAAKAANDSTNAEEVHASGEKRLQAGREQEPSTPSGQQGMVEVSCYRKRFHFRSFLNPSLILCSVNVVLLAAKV